MRGPKLKLQSHFGRLLTIILVAVAAAVFSAVLQHDFVTWDDDLHVYDNPRFQPVTWDHIGTFWQSPYQHLYIPLTYTVWAAITWGTQTVTGGQLIAAPFHYTNLVLHLLSMLMVYRLGFLVLSQGEMSTDHRTALAAAFGALVFGVHPLQVEAVAWVSGLKDVLWGFWAFVALWQYLEYARAGHRSRQMTHYGLATGAFALALLAKPAAVVVPIIAWLLHTGGLGRSWRCATRALLPWVVLAGLWGIGTKGQQPDVLLAWVPSWWGRLVVAADALAFYAAKLLWPLGLVPDYGRTPQMVLEQAWGVRLGLVLLGFAVVLRHTRRKWSGLWFGATIFVAGLLPVLGVVPFAFQTYSTVADRYVYVAILGPALGLAWVMLRTGLQWPCWVIGSVVLAMLAVRSADQSRVWRDTETLFTHTLRINPDSALAHNNLGLILAQQGAMHKAASHFQKALITRPDLPEAHYNLGMALTLQGDLNKAIMHYTQALKLRPNWAEVHNNLGIALEGQGQYADAVASYAKALLSKPNWADAHYNLGNALSKQGRLEEAEMAYRLALRQRPSWPRATTRLADLLLTPASVPAVTAAEAVHLAEAACSATDYQDADALLVLARAYQTTGRLEAARHAAGQALALATAAGLRALMTEIKSHFPTASVQEPTHAAP